ncbi:MAG: MFS transporter, partial [Methanobrevibacter sp.]|nr:MFS transporter [Methanobrevibacter sp.]
FGEAFGYFMLGTTIAVGLGPYISGFFYDNWGSIGSFSLATSFAFLGLLCIILLDISKYEIIHNSEIENGIVDEDEEAGEEKGTIRRVIDKIFEIPAIPVSLFTGLTSLGYVSILSFYRLYAVEVDLVGAFSLFFIIYSIVLVASRPIAGRIQDNYGDRIICFTGIIAQAIGLFLVAWMPSALTVFICAVCAALGFGTLNSACTAIVTRDTLPNRRPYAISTFFIFCDGTMGFGPALLGSFVSATSGYAPVYFISSFITLLALPIAFFALKK